MKKLGVIAGIFGLLAVITGAFGAHALEGKLPENLQAAWSTAVQYQFYHTLALAACAVLLQKAPTKNLYRAGYCFIAGIILFSGSLYLMAIGHLVSPGSWNWIGPLTPIGGLFFIAGWLFLIAFFASARRCDNPLRE